MHQFKFSIPLISKIASLRGRQLRAVCVAHIYHAAMLDPLTASILSIDEIYSMTDKLLEAHNDFLPDYN